MKKHLAVSRGVERRKRRSEEARRRKREGVKRSGWRSARSNLYRSPVVETKDGRWTRMSKSMAMVMYNAGLVNFVSDGRRAEIIGQVTKSKRRRTERLGLKRIGRTGKSAGRKYGAEHEAVLEKLKFDNVKLKIELAQKVKF